MSSISQTSGASATISGIAALIFSVHPNWSNAAVRTRLKSSGSHPFERNWQNGYGPVNAYKAVGGVTWIQIAGNPCATPGEQVPLTAEHDGDGPFAYQWSNWGGTDRHTLITASSTVGGVVTTSVSVTDLRSGQNFTAQFQIVTTLSESGECTGSTGSRQTPQQQSTMGKPRGGRSRLISARQR